MMLCILVIMIVGTTAGKASLLSTKFLRQAKNTLSLKHGHHERRKVSARMIRSCQKIEIKCFDTPVTIITPLLIIVGCNKFTVKVGLLA